MYRTFLNENIKMHVNNCETSHPKINDNLNHIVLCTFPIRTTVGISRPTTQWAAVKINCSEIIEPPQLNAKSSAFISCDG